MQPLELFGSFIQLNLSSLRFSYFLFQLVGLASYFNRELLDLQRQLFDFGFICASVFLKSEVVFFLLTCRESPLLQLFLVPVHLEFELVHSLVGLEDHVLNVV